MSSYLYDPHSLRQKPNRYYQRKGQINQVKKLGNVNPAISKEDAEKYITAVIKYFPEIFDLYCPDKPCPPQPPCPDPPSCEYLLSLTAHKVLDFDDIETGYLTQYLGCFERIKNVETTNTCILMYDQGNLPPDEMSFEQAKYFSWLSPEDFGTFIAAKQSDGNILYFDATTGKFRKFAYDEWANTLQDWEQKFSAIAKDVKLYQYYCGNSLLYLTKTPRFITYSLKPKPQN